MSLITPRVARRAARWAAVALVPVAAVLGGCSTDKLLAVTNPSIAQPSSLAGKSGLAAYYAAAIGDFTDGYAGDNGDPLGYNIEGLINFGGLLSDEVGSTDTYPTRNEVDRRSTQFNNSSNADIFRAIQRSRSDAELAASQFSQFASDDARHSEVLSLAGYSYILIAETYCSGVPFSQIASDGTTISYGQPLTTDQIFQTAVAKFDTALTIAVAANVDSLANFARVGRARALLGLNQRAAAAAQVADVPSSFSYQVFTSANTSRQNNGVYGFSVIQQRFSAIDKEGGNGLPYLSANDPRVPYTDTKNTGFDGARNLALQQKYPQRTSPVTVANGVEARYIQAEAALATGDVGSFMDFLQQARTAAGNTAAVTDPGTPESRVDLLFRERAFSLWLTAHRLGDMRRLVRYYSRSADTVFPVGDYSGGGTYGTDVNLPIPVEEQNNKLYKGECNKAAP